MKFLLFLPFTVILFACDVKSDNEVSDNKLNQFKTYVKSVHEKPDSIYKLVSFRFVRYNTLTQEKFYVARLDEIGDRLKCLNDELKCLNDEMESLKNFAQNLENTYISLSTYETRVTENKRETSRILREAAELSEKSSSIILQLLRADKSKQIGFEAECMYQLQRKDRLLQNDTAFIILDMDKNIIDGNNLGELQ